MTPEIAAAENRAAGFTGWTKPADRSKPPKDRSGAYLENLVRRLAARGMCNAEISRATGYSPAGVYVASVRAGIDVRDGRANRRDRWVQAADDGLTARQAAELMGVSANSAYRAEDRYGIKFRRIWGTGRRCRK